MNQDPAADSPRANQEADHPLLERGTPAGYLAAIGATALATGICFLLLGRLELLNLVMVYLVGVTFVASRFGPREAILCSLLSVAAFDFMFVHPSWTFAVSDGQYIVTFAVMLGVALVISTLTLQVRRQARMAEEREKRTAALHRLSEDLARESQEARLAAETERMRNTLLTSISHDLRTPLTSIAGAADTLRRGEGNTGELAATIYSESMRLDLQVQNLLDMTRLQGGQVKPNLQWQSVEELLGSAISRAEEGLKPRTLRVNLQPGLPLVRGDAALLDRLFGNLLENAGRHTPPDATVEITAASDGRTVRVEVMDNGPGIPAGQEETVFEQFKQAGAAASGFGLGLAICRAIATLHGGLVRAENRLSGGVALIVELPATAQPEVPVG